MTACVFVFLSQHSVHYNFLSMVIFNFSFHVISTVFVHIFIPHPEFVSFLCPSVQEVSLRSRCVMCIL